MYAARPLAVLVAAFALSSAGGASAAPGAGGGLCPVLALVPPLACREGTPTPGTAQEAAPAPDEQSDKVPRTPTSIRFDPGRITVTLKRNATGRQIEAAFAAARVTPVQAIPKIRAYMVAVDPSRANEAIESLRSSRVVASAGQEVLADALDTTPNDTDWPQQWGLRVARLPEAWGQSQGAKPIVVAVVDTGVDPGQPDLSGALVPGHDFVHQSANPADDEGHGTAVAGVIAARTNNHEGIAGVCGSCLIMPVKVLDSTGVGDDSVIAAGIVWAADHGARVINLSLGGPGTTPALDDAVAYATRKGAFVAAAAGNSSSTAPFYPAASPLAVGVAATTEADRPYSWSNSGSWAKLAAPGCNPAPRLAGGYGMFCGTSAATPIVAGLAALSLGANPTAGPQQLEQALDKAALAMPGFVRYGRIDAPGTLAALAAAMPPPPPQEITAVVKGRLTGRAPEQSYTRSVQAGSVIAALAFKGARSLTLTLIPQDPAGETVRVAGPSPLRLERVLPSGTVRFVVRGAANATYTLTITNRAS